MCGIVGYAGPDIRVDAAAPLLKQMTDAIAHRGPDGEGVHVGVGFGLGHRRLAIVDLSCDAAQPMASADGSTWITYNGEVFNHVELRRMLEARGRVFRSTSDTEVVLQLYEEFGTDFASHLNGDFALAIWDERKRRLVLARDRMGVRPLFHTWHKGTFYFASEVKALLRAPGVEAEIDLRALDQVFTLWATVAPRTMFRGIEQLPPAHIMVVENGSARALPYWALEFPDADLVDGRSEAVVTEEVRALLDDATRIRLRADVEVGSFLSGGLDSAAVAGLAARHLPGRLNTFAVGFDSPEFDERAFQERVASALGTNHRTVLCGLPDIAAAFPDIIRHAEQPLLRTAPAPLYHLAGLVRESGLKVVLTGEGADEVFAGYDLFKEARIRRFCARQPKSAFRAHLFRRIYPYLPGLSQQTPEYLSAFFSIRSDRLDDPLFSHRPRMRATIGAKIFYSGDLRSTLGDYDATEELVARLPASFSRWHPLHQAQYLEFSLLMPGYILSAQGDRVAMAHGIETRFPFLDHRLVELAANIAPSMKLRGLREKHVLRQATRDLMPREISDRPKQPYRAPDSASFAHDGAGYFQEATSTAALASTGLFNPQATARLVEKCRRAPLSGFRDNAALVAIVSTQLWQQEFSTTSDVKPTAPHASRTNSQ